MNNIKNFIKGIIVGIGGIAPGLSGSVFMVILGLYTKVIGAIADLFKDFKKNILFLLPIGIGMVIGIVLFSNLISFSIENYEIPTRLAFFGLLVGTIPFFYRETEKKEKLNYGHYVLMVIAFIIGLYLLSFSADNKSLADLNILQAFILGFFGISAMIIPGIDGASLLSAMGLYGSWLDLTSLKSISLVTYGPAFLGIVTGGFTLSIFINRMIKKNYTDTFSILFGLFLSILPGILKTNDGSFLALSNNLESYVGIFIFLVAMLGSYFFGKFSEDIE